MNQLDKQVYTKEDRARDKSNYTPVKYAGNSIPYVDEAEISSLRYEWIKIIISYVVSKFSKLKLALLGKK